MESDHNANYDGSATNRNGIRTKRPRLADLLESVKVPDEALGNGSNGSTGSYSTEENVHSVSTSVSAAVATEPVAFEPTNPSVDRAWSSGSESTLGRGHSGDHADNYVDAHVEADTMEGQSAASIAAQKRRQALYSRRNSESTPATDATHRSSMLPDSTVSGHTVSGHTVSGDTVSDNTILNGTVHNDTVRNGTARNGTVHNSTARNGTVPDSNGHAHNGTREFDSLANRLFGDRASSSFDASSSSAPSSSVPSSGSALSGSSEVGLLTPRETERGPASTSSPQPSAVSPVDSLLQSSSSTAQGERPISDWTAKYAADAPLPAALDLSAGREQKISAMENRNPASDLQPTQYEQPATRRFSTTSPSPNESLNSVNIKGRSDGVSIELGQGQWPDIIDALSQRLVQSTGFFRGGKVTLDVGVRPLQERELEEICVLTEQHGLTVTSVRSRSEQSCQIALAAGLAASLDAPDGLLAQPALSNYEKLEHFVYRGNLRSGQILRRAETILVMGDVNPGSQIISDSDVLVWGRLRGIAHAGASGDTNSVIAALLMEPTQIRIADAIAILPEQETKTSIAERLAGNTAPSGVKRPEIAHSIGEDIIVDVWDDSKPGGIMAFRRSHI